MTYRGRKSAEELSVVPIDVGRVRIEPPETLEEKAAGDIQRSGRFGRAASFPQGRHSVAGELCPSDLLGEPLQPQGWRSRWGV